MPEESLALLAVVIAVVVGLRDQAEQRRRNRAGGEQGRRQSVRADSFLPK